MFRRSKAKRPEDTIIMADIDDTINDLLSKWCCTLNAQYHENVMPWDIKEWDLNKYYPSLTKEQIIEPLTHLDFWASVQPKPGAVYMIDRLIREGFQVYLVTATDYRNILPKYELFVKKHFQRIDPQHIIVTYKKQLLLADYLIDDAPHNLEGGKYKKILMSAPHNEAYDADSAGIIRVKTWIEVYDIIRNDLRR